MNSSLLSYLLHHQAARSPQRPVLSCEGEITSYGELERLSDRLAGALAEGGVGHGDRVGLYLPKSRSAYAALFAALKVGGAYVPLDPAAPTRRVAYTVEDCGLRALVTTPQLAQGLLGSRTAASLRLVLTDGEPPASPPRGVAVIPLAEAVAAGAPAPPNPASEDDLAYVLYTSGSTGLPKGVMVSHRGALAFAQWAAETVELGPDDRVAAVAELHFDLSIFDLFATVSAGATLLPLPAGGLLRPRQLARWIADEDISVWYSTPSTLVLLLTEGRIACVDGLRLRRVLFAGEVFPVKHLRELRGLLPAARLYNLYGPTETNVCTWKRIDAVPDDDRVTVPIGRACAGTEVVALREDGRECADDEEGELWVRGPTLMRGYWGDPAKTAATIRPRSSGSGPGERWYRTGDLVHRDEQGDHHFHGRRDHMVKIRGYRVELGEVETALYGHPEVRELAVVATGVGGPASRLRACVVPHDPDGFSPLRLKSYLARRLPDYMIPEEIRCFAELPKTSTGKVDRRRLAADHS